MVFDRRTLAYIKAKRLEEANEFIKVIAVHGRMFFNHQGTISYLAFDKQGRINFQDSYSKRLIYTHYNGRWRGFSQGGTLKRLIVHLRDYVRCEIKTGDDLFRVLPIHYADKRIFPDHPWGYPEADMTIVIEAARRIFCTNHNKEETSHGS